MTSAGQCLYARILYFKIRLGPGSEGSREREGQGANRPGSELARVLSADLLRGANWPRSEKAVNRTTVMHFSLEMHWQNDAQCLINRNKLKSARETYKVIPGKTLQSDAPHRTSCAGATSYSIYTSIGLLTSAALGASDRSNA